MTKLRHFPDQLSGGEQQRVSVARAFVNHPPPLLADEPTGNLDPETSIGIMQLLYRINRTGTTVIVATHDSAMVDRMRRRVIEQHHAGRPNHHKRSTGSRSLTSDWRAISGSRAPASSHSRVSCVSASRVAAARRAESIPRPGLGASRRSAAICSGSRPGTGGRAVSKPGAPS